ncbi:hypothetical protein [uncultured Ruminococcus sp.]|uniref:hypothetical protein n=1 Tax=uncultured Ruminococcus sp. TaxID=165186 RepID=UPI002627762A|nr:hypothetical protein [uncultured Ruminococcus sp.]
MKKFFASLSHNAKITLITCGCFVMLTMLILIFLMLCPIQESSSANYVNDSLVVTTSVTENTLAATEEATETTKFARKTTDAHRKTTAASHTRRTEAVENNDTEDPNAYQTPAYNEPDTPAYIPATTTKSHWTSTAPTVTQPVTEAPVPVVTESPAQTIPPAQVPDETLPIPDDAASYD